MIHREIEFRMWDKNLKKYVYGPVVFDYLRQQLNYNNGVIDVDAYDHIADGKVFEEYIGIKDTNEVKMFENDIDISGWAVTYCGDQEAGLGMNVGWYLQRDDFESWIELDSRINANGDNYEIIGNIHEGVKK